MKIFHFILGFITDDVQAGLLLEVGLWQESWYVFYSLKDACYTDFFPLTELKISGLVPKLSKNNYIS